MNNLQHSIQQQFSNLDLPPVQRSFVDHFDGTLSTLVTFPQLQFVLNPTFNYHYHYVSGGDLNERTGNFNDILTTRDTDGSSSAWGQQSKEAEHNAYLLSRALKDLLLTQQLYMLDFSNNYVPYDPTWGRVKKKLFLLIAGEYKRIAGLTNRNLYY